MDRSKLNCCVEGCELIVMHTLKGLGCKRTVSCCSNHLAEARTEIHQCVVHRVEFDTKERVFRGHKQHQHQPICQSLSGCNNPSTHEFVGDICGWKAHLCSKHMDKLWDEVHNGESFCASKKCDCSLQIISYPPTQHPDQAYSS